MCTMMQGASTTAKQGSDGLQPLSSFVQRRLPTTQKLCNGFCEKQKDGPGQLLVTRCDSRARKTLKNKRHTLQPPQNHVLALVSALTVEDTNHYAALEYHSKSMVLSDWFVLLEELGRGDHWLLTLEVFRWMQQQKWYKPDDGFYAKIISILGKQGHLRLAVWLFKEMKKHGCRPDTSVLNSLISAHVRNNNNKEVALVKALGYYEVMKKTSRCQPNLVTYNTLLRACAQAKETKKMEDLFNEMDLAGLKPDTYTFNGILDAHGKAGDFLDMELVLKRMRSSKVKPDFISYNTLIDSYGKAGIIVKMEEALKSMAVAKVKPQLSTFNALINNYGTAKRVNEMETVFKSMSSMGVAPSLVTYEVLMKGYGNCGCFDKMRNCLYSMHKGVVLPGSTTLNAVMEAYCKNDLLEEAESLLDSASHLGVVPTHLSYLILYKAYSKHDYTDKSEALLKKMGAAGIKPNDKFFLQSLESATLESKPRKSRRDAKLSSLNDLQQGARGSNATIESSKAVLLHA